MTWNPSLPADASKLRLSAGYIRTNWNTLETGNVPFDYLQLEKQGANPTRQNNRGWVYAKDPGTGFTELFYQDDRNPALITQITNNNRLGITTQGVNALNFIMDNTTFAYAKNQMIVATASVDQAGNLLSGVNINSTSSSGTGLYTVKIAADCLLTVQYKVIAIAVRNSGNFRGMQITSKPVPVAAMTTDITLEARSTSDALTNVGFDFVVIGGR